MTKHASDCAVHNAPALPIGPCDCGTENEWLPIETAPKDGTWFLLDIEDGTNDCIDDAKDYRPARYLGRWNPTRYPDLDVNFGRPAVYEWEVLGRDGEFTHWADGRAAAWQPLPPKS